MLLEAEYTCFGLRGIERLTEHTVASGPCTDTYAAFAAAGFLSLDQSVVELSAQDLDSPAPLPQRLRVSLIFEHMEDAHKCGSTCNSPVNSSSSCRGSNSLNSACRDSNCFSGSTYCPPPSHFGGTASASERSLCAAGVGDIPSVKNLPGNMCSGNSSSNVFSPSGKSPPSKSIVSGIVSTLLRWQQPRENALSGSDSQNQHQLSQQQEFRASRRFSTCSSVSITEGAQLASSEAAAAAGAASAPASGETAVTSQRHLHITKRPTASRRDFVARHRLQLDPVRSLACCFGACVRLSRLISWSKLAVLLSDPSCSACGTKQLRRCRAGDC